MIRISVGAGRGKLTNNINQNKMNNLPSREREPELKEILNQLESLSAQFDSITVGMKNKICAIYSPSELTSSGNPMKPVADKEIPNDMIGQINKKILGLQEYHTRLTYLNEILGRII